MGSPRYRMTSGARCVAEDISLLRAQSPQPLNYVNGGDLGGPASIDRRHLPTFRLSLPLAKNVSSDSAFRERCFISTERPIRLAADDPFRPGRIHHTPARAIASR